MGWWEKLFKESTGSTKVTPVDDKPEDYSEKVTPYNQDPPVVVYSNEPKKVTPKRDIKPIDLGSVSFKASPNKSNRTDGDPTHIVLHHTGPGSFNGIVNWLCNPAAKASAHYIVGTGAQLKQIVNTKKKAWHAGKAKWDGRTDVNNFTIGIEICNIGILEKRDDGYYYEQGRKMVKYKGKAQPVAAQITYPNGSVTSGYVVPYPQKQLDKVVALCKALVEKYPAITKDNIITHFEVATPTGRKNDPFGLDVEELKNLIFG